MADAVPDLLRQIHDGSGHVSLPAGDYEIASPLVVDVPVVITGVPGTVLRRTTGSITVVADNVTVSDLKIDAGGDRVIAMRGDGGTLHNVEVANFGRLGILAFGENVVIDSCNIHSPGVSGLTMAIWRDAGTDEGAPFTVRGCNIDSTSPYITGGVVHITGNTVRNSLNPGGGQLCLGASYNSVTTVFVEDNFIEFGGTNLCGGLELGGGRFFVRRNVIRNHALCGIGLGNYVVQAEITDNIVSNSGQNTRHPARSAIRVARGVSNLLITRNLCFDDQLTKTQTYGVELTADPAQVAPGNKIRVVGNSCSGNLIAPTLNASGATDCQVYGNV